MELVFSAVVCRHVVRVPITKDSLFEVNERFRASLSMVENNGINVVVDPVLATVTIEDDDGEVHASGYSILVVCSMWPRLTTVCPLRL